MLIDNDWPVDDDTFRSDEEVTDLPSFVLLSDFLKVATWLCEHEQSESHPFALSVSENAPSEIRGITQQLNSLTARDFLIGGESQEDVVLAIKEAPTDKADCFSNNLSQVLSGFDERDFDIFVRRFTKTIPDSLSSIGDDYGISRERIRQLEAEIRKRLAPVFKRFKIRSKLTSLFDQGIPFLTCEQATLRFPELNDVLPGLNAPLANIILSQYSHQIQLEIKDGWVAAPTIKDAQTFFDNSLERFANKYGVLPEDSLAKYVFRDKNKECSIEITKNWLQYSGADFYKGHVILQPTKTRMSMAILSIEHKPMSAEEIAAAIQLGTNIVNVSNMLSANPETVRVNKDDWGLREWDMKPYVSIRQVIYDKIQAYGGAIDQKQLIDELVDEYSLNAKTIYHYCSGSPFRTVKGVISIANEETNDPIVAMIEKAHIPYFDYRDKGGSLWVIGGYEELKEFMNGLRAKGADFHYRSGGGRVTQGQDAWWWKE